MLAVACSSSRNAGGVSDVVTADNESFQLKNDTLYSSTGLKFFRGQKLIIGNPAGNEGITDPLFTGPPFYHLFGARTKGTITPSKIM